MARTFKAKVSGEGPGGAWCRIKIPFSVEKAFGSKGRVSVKATVGRKPFHTSIFPNGDGTHHMMFNKAMQSAAGAHDGDTIAITLDPNKGYETEVPAPLKAALKREVGAGTMFKGLTPAGRREFINWIMSAKHEGTRAARSAKAVEMILAGKKRYSS